MQAIKSFASFLIDPLATSLVNLHDRIGIVATYGAYGIGWKSFIEELGSHDFESSYHITQRKKSAGIRGRLILVTRRGLGLGGRGMAVTGSIARVFQLPGGTEMTVMCLNSA